MSVIFWGATGQAKVLREALPADRARLVALFDNRNIQSPFEDVPIFHGEPGFLDWEQTSPGHHQIHACVAIGGSQGEDRLSRTHWLRGRGYAPLTIVHARAFVAGDVQVGNGCQILAMSAVCAGAQLGEAVIVNTNASVDHDCVIGDGVHIAPGATLAGEVMVDKFAFIGTGAVILPRIRIGAHAIIGAGAVVTRDVVAGTTVTGCPARPYFKDQK
nr:NeuD/PglB/VioB family sugar acetyltransferase [Dyella sp. 2HG41-7]